MKYITEFLSNEDFIEAIRFKENLRYVKKDTINDYCAVEFPVLEINSYMTKAEMVEVILDWWDNWDEQITDSIRPIIERIPRNHRRASHFAAKINQIVDWINENH